MASAAEIRNKAAKKLGLYGTGQVLRSAISADFDTAYSEIYAELKAKNIAPFVSTDVPEHLVWPVVALVAASRANEYSVPEPKYSRVMADAIGAEGLIRTLISPRKHGVTKAQNY